MDKVFPLFRDVYIVGIGIVVAEPHRVEPWGLLCVAGEHRLHRERSRGSVLSVSVFSLLINTWYGTVARAHVILLRIKHLAIQANLEAHYFFHSGLILSGYMHHVSSLLIKIPQNLKIIKDSKKYKYQTKN